MELDPQSITVGGALLGVLGTLLFLIRGHFGRMETKADNLAMEVHKLAIAITELVGLVHVIRTTPPIGIPWKGPGQP